MIANYEARIRVSESCKCGNENQKDRVNAQGSLGVHSMFIREKAGKYIVKQQRSNATYNY